VVLNLATAMYNGNAGEVTIFSVARGVSYALPAGSTTDQSVAFSPNGSYLATAEPFGSTGSNSVTFSPNGSYLATANNSNDVTIFSVATGGSLSGGVSSLYLGVLLLLLQ
jgi:hypothetical protein